MKIAVVGGGSTYTPELIDGLVNGHGGLVVDEVCLMDTDAARLKVVGDFAVRLAAGSGSPTTVTSTTDLASAVDGAAAVLIQLRIGGQDARLSDETFPLECGCLGQETTGAGGLAKALRTVPVVLDIAEQIRRIAGADTWIIDFTNPVGIVTRALLQGGFRAVGLCNVAINFQHNFAALLDVDPGRVQLQHVGLNHLSWENGVLVDGVDRLPFLLDRRLDEVAATFRLTPQRLRLLGAMPSYYLNYYYSHDEVVARERTELPRAAVVQRLETELLELYRDPQLVTKPAQLDERGGRRYSLAAIQLVSSLLQDTGDVQVVNVRNDGVLPFLPTDAVVEAPARITAAGPVPLPGVPVQPLQSGLIGHTFGYEQLALEAALNGGRDRVYRALLAHPLIGQYDLAEQLTDRLLAANGKFLPWA